MTIQRRSVATLLVLRFGFIIVGFTMPSKGSGQDSTIQIFTALIDEVIDLDPPDMDIEKVKITNLHETKLNDAPGSVYVVTALDIERNGYRDLVDIFADIPGFNIASDVQNGTGLALRGAWGAEAKILFMIDGMIMNDMSYGSFVLGGRIPLINVERIEIIRGASSSIYGGIAGLGVVNIITRSGNAARGNSFQTDVGFSGKNFSGNRLSFANTSYLLNGFELSVSSSIFSGNKSNELYTHPDTSVVSNADSSRMTDVYVQLRLKKNSFEYKMLYDDYTFKATHEEISSRARTFINDIAYDKQFNKLRVHANFNLKDQIPWNTEYGDPAIYDAQNLKTRRITFSSDMTYEITDKMNVLLGGQYYNDYMRMYRPSLLLNDGQSSNSYNALAGFAEYTLRTKFANIFAGGRLDYYQTFKPNFSPRLSITKDFKYFHYKLIYGESFKIPTLQNINITYFNASPISPEKIRDAQIELGIRNAKNELKIGAFLTRIDDVVVYGYDLATFTESYFNNGQITFAGYELTMKNKVKKFDIFSTYSHYELLSASAADFMVDETDVKKGTLAIPKHKATFRISYPINDKNRISLNYIFLSKKVGVEQIDATLEEYANVEHGPTNLIDLMFQTRGFLKYFDVTTGIKNILNTKNLQLYPGNGGYPSGIGMGREIFVQLKVNL